jgi:hypothetical protein
VGIVFNYPERCTDGSCDVDDLAEDATVKGGVYQADGRVAEGEGLEFDGSVRPSWQDARWQRRLAAVERSTSQPDTLVGSELRTVRRVEPPESR